MADNITRLLDTGVVGINFEDRGSRDRGCTTPNGRPRASAPSDKPRTSMVSPTNHGSLSSTADLATAPAFLGDLAAALSEYCGVPYDGLWMNWYRDHRGQHQLARVPTGQHSPDCNRARAQPGSHTPIPDSAQYRRTKHDVHSCRRRCADHAGTMPARLAAQCPETANTRRTAHERELQQHHASGDLTAGSS